MRCSEECGHAEGRYGKVLLSLRLTVLSLFSEGALSSLMVDNGLRLSTALREDRGRGIEMGGGGLRLGAVLCLMGRHCPSLLT